MASRMARLGAWTVDLADGVVHLSDEACAIYGLPDGSTFGLIHAFDQYRSDSRPVIAAAFMACARNGTPFELELEIATAGGRRVPVRICGEAALDTDGRVEGLRGALQDISLLRDAQGETERIGARLARTLESVTDAFYTLDREWRFTYLNPEAERLQQRTRAQLLGRSVWDAFPEAVGSVFDIEFHRAVETGEPAIFESYYAPLKLWVSVRAFPSEDGLAVYFLDTNDRRVGEEALMASEQRARAMFERAGDAIFLSDDTGHFVDANAAASVMLGLPREALIGRQMDDFIVPEEGEDIDPVARWQYFLSVGELRGEVRMQVADGQIAETEFVAVANTSPGLHMAILRDISERRRYERAAGQRERLLEALRRLTPGDDPEATATAICADMVAHGGFASATIRAFGADDDTPLGASFRDGRDVAGIQPLSSERMAMLQAKAVVGPWVDDLQTGGSPPCDGTADPAISAIAYAPIVSDGRPVGLLIAGSEEAAAELSLRIPALVEFAALGSALLGPGLRSRAVRATERERLREIVKTRAFKPVFQPIVDMRNGTVIGYEALTRFLDRTPPDLVFRQAAEVGVGLELEAATIEAALDASPGLPPDTFLDINVSPDMVMAGEPLRALLGRTSRRVILEITEHVNVEDYVGLREAVTTLGPDVRFAVDDAGAGFSSLRHILELRPSHVKLDRALVARIDSDPARQALVAGLVHFAAAIDSMLVAEGVETLGERDALLGLGVDTGQGFLLGLPASVDRAARVSPMTEEPLADR